MAITVMTAFPLSNRPRPSMPRHMTGSCCAAAAAAAAAFLLSLSSLGAGGGDGTLHVASAFSPPLTPRRLPSRAQQPRPQQQQQPPQPQSARFGERRELLPPLFAKGFGKATASNAKTTKSNKRNRRAKPTCTTTPNKANKHDDPRTATLTNLLSWSTSASIQSSNSVTLSPHNNVSPGLGLRSTHPLSSGDVALSIPHRVILSSRELQFDLDEEALHVITAALTQEGLDTYAPEFYLMLRLLEEYVACTASSGECELGPWMESLPTTFDMGIYFDEVERDYLPQLAGKLLDLQERQLDVFRKTLDKLAEMDERYQTLLNMCQDSSDCGTEEGGLRSIEDVVQWAFSVVFSRSWRSPSQSDDARIVPLADCCNHGDADSASNVLIEEPEGSYGPTQVVLKTDVDHDTELLLSYGPGYDPSRFFIIFGFFDAKVEEVFCGVAFTDPSEELVNLGCTDRSKMVYRRDGAIANAVWDTILYATLAQNPEEQQLFYDAHVRGDAEAFQSYHRKYRLEVAASLRNHVEQVLKTEYPVPTDAELSTLDWAQHPRLKMILQHNRFMRTVFTNVRDRLEKTIRLEVEKRRAEMQEQDGGSEGTN